MIVGDEPPPSRSFTPTLIQHLSTFAVVYEGGAPRVDRLLTPSTATQSR